MASDFDSKSVRVGEAERDRIAVTNGGREAFARGGPFGRVIEGGIARTADDGDVRHRAVCGDVDANRHVTLDALGLERGWKLGSIGLQTLGFLELGVPGWNVAGDPLPRTCLRSRGRCGLGRRGALCLRRVGGARVRLAHPARAGREGWAG